MKRREAIAFYLTIAPWLVGFLAFTAGPMLLSLYASFTDWDLLTDPTFTALGNYQALLEDSLFWQSLKVTATYTLLYVPLDLVGGLALESLCTAFPQDAGGLALALLARPRLRGIGAFRTIFYLPTVFSGVAFVVVWLWMLNPNGGLVNLLLAQFGIHGPRWLLDPKTALLSLVLMSFWGWGRSMAIFLGGLQTIPGALYEAAAIDGAGKIDQFLHITLPLITPTIFFNLLLSVIATFQTFTGAFVATNGGPLDSTLFLVLYIYRQAFEYLHMGYAAALAWVLFGVILIFTLLLMRSQRFWVFYLGERSDA